MIFFGRSNAANTMKQMSSQAYMERCRHPEVQALRPDTEAANGLWVPTAEQLQEILARKLPYPERSVFQRTAEGWEYRTDFREWAADYGTYIDTQRCFVATEPEIALLQALMALLGLTERWMV